MVTLDEFSACSNPSLFKKNEKNNPQINVEFKGCYLDFETLSFDKSNNVQNYGCDTE